MRAWVAAPVACAVGLVIVLAILLLGPGGAGTLHKAGPAPKSSDEFSRMMAEASRANETLLTYLYPSLENLTSDVRHNWAPSTRGCEVKTDCWCFHVRGDMSSSKNPGGWRTCSKSETLKSSCNRQANDCACFSGDDCLFSDMRPTKLLAVAAVAKLAGITHIIEEGRFGGLSAHLYDSVLGLRVTSVEFLPLVGPTNALTRLSPGVRMLNGDGKVLVPELVANMTDEEAAHTLVIFDGEKRFGAHETYLKIRDRVGVAIFDDTNLKDGPEFKKALADNGYVLFDTTDKLYDPFVAREAVPLTLLEPLNDERLRRERDQGTADKSHAAARWRKGSAQVRWQGGVNMLATMHFTIVRGGAWR